jgi:hypothetical protein
VATVGGEVVGGTAISAGSGFLLHVDDNAESGASDLLRLEFLSSVPTSCPPANPVSPTAVTSGDIAVVDSAAPPASIENLIGDVQALGLDRGTEVSLTAKLFAAADTGAPAGCNLLDSFVNHVEALREKRLLANEADNLLASAAGVQVALGC